jgi:hypothetical protein
LSIKARKYPRADLGRVKTKEVIFRLLGGKKKIKAEVKVKREVKREVLVTFKDKEGGNKLRLLDIKEGINNPNKLIIIDKLIKETSGLFIGIRL